MNTPTAVKTTITIEIFDHFQRWINQRPGLDTRNYYDAAELFNGNAKHAKDGIRAYRQECRTITADGTRARKALRTAREYEFDGEKMQQALEGSFSGRLEWKTDLCNCVECKECQALSICALCGNCTRQFDHAPNCAGCPEGKNGRFEYTTGQYWPTEYRKAAATVLEQYIYNVKPKRQPNEPDPAKFHSIEQIVAAVTASGSHFFDKETMHFFRSRTYPELFYSYKLVYFVTSEQREVLYSEPAPRLYTVRTFDPVTADLGQVGEFQQHSTKAQALKAAADAAGLDVKFRKKKERKTREEFQIQGNYGQGWEEVTAEDTRKEAQARLKEYRENQPEYPHRLVVKRVPIEAATK